MIRTICIFAFATAALAVPQRFEKVDGDNRIVNGTDAPQGKYPSVVSLRWLGTHRCGGSIVNENWVVTAAHCIDGEDLTDQYLVYAGNVDLEGNGEIYEVAQLIVHEDFDTPSKFVNDIALVKVATPFTFSNNIQVANLPNQNQDTEGGSSATVVGWGHPYTGGDYMQFLQEVDVFVVSDPDCEAVHSGDPFPSNICAGVPGGGKGTCKGDSGGPLYVNGEQVGIMSWSIKPCTVPPYPGVYTEVAWYVDWITAHIN